MKSYLTKHYKLSLFLLLLIIGFVSYAPELNGEFIFDDPQYVENNPVYNNFNNFINDKRRMTQRPLYWFSFFVEKKLWGNNPAGYKTVNVLFHVFAAFVFFFFIRKLLGFKNKDNIPDEKVDFNNFHFLFSFFASLLFIVSPIVIEGVSYISGRNNGIGGFFFILGGYLFLKSIESSEIKKIALFSGLTLLAFLCSFLFKEIYIVFPGFCIMLYLTLKKISKKGYLIISSIILILALILSYATFNSNIQPFPRIKKVINSNMKSFNQKTLATNIYAIGYSMHLATFPDKLNIDHDLPVIEKLIDHRVIAIVGFIIFVFGLLFYYRKHLPFSLLAYSTYLLLMLPSNSFILRGSAFEVDPISERNLYAPALFYTIILLEIIWVACKKDIKKFKIVSLAFFVIFGIRTFARNMDFRNNVTLWKASVKYSPNRARPNYNFAAALKDVGRINEAIPYAKKAFKLKPRENTLGLLSTLYKFSGDNAKYENLLKSAIKKKRFKKAEIFHQLGEIYSSQGKYDNAIKFFKRAIKKKPYFMLSRLSLTYILLEQKKLDEAKQQIDFMEKTLEKQKGKYFSGVLLDNVVNSRVVFAKSLYMFAIKKDKEGIGLCHESLKLNPNFTEPLLKLAEYYYLRKEDKKAWDYLYKASKTSDYFKYKKIITPMIVELQKSLGK